MKKPLSQMTLEELWTLFPIELIPHQEEWKYWYVEEKEILFQLFQNNEFFQLTHIGSTAIQSICAKPIVDILIEVPRTEDMFYIENILTKNDYICMSKSEDRISFNKGYTANGFAQKVFHLHIRIAGDNDEIYFRDYLNEHLDIAKEYEKLKLSLWKKYEYNRDAYTEAKTEFVSKYTKIAKKEEEF